MGSLTYIDHILNNRLIGRHFGPLHHPDLGSDPGHEHELAALGHLVAHLYPNVAEGPFVVRELAAELVEAHTLLRADDFETVKFEHRPLVVGQVGPDVLVRFPNRILVQGGGEGHL